MREIRTLRARWRELETELRTRRHGHEGGNPGYGQADVLQGHRASSRPYQPMSQMIEFLSAQAPEVAWIRPLAPPLNTCGLGDYWW